MREAVRREEEAGVKIDKNIPMPDRFPNGAFGTPAYPFADMEVGDSFEVHGLRETEHARNQASMYAYHSKDNRKFATRIVAYATLRIWRTS